MARIVQTIFLSELDTLPKTTRCAADLDCNGASITVREDGSLRVAVWLARGEQTPFIRYSYEVDVAGSYVLGSARYSGYRISDDPTELSPRQTDWTL
jgi:hypothetical protein